MYFSENSALIKGFQQRHLASGTGELYGACNAALDVVMNQVERYDERCKYLPKISGVTAVDHLRSGRGAESVAFLLYFFTASIREVTALERDRSSYEQSVLDRFRDVEIARSKAWGGWYKFYEDLIFNLLPLRMTEDYLGKISDGRDQIATVHASIKQADDELQGSFIKLKSALDEHAEGHKKSLFDEIGDISERVNGYRGELSKIASEYNFVGLSHAFKLLISKKDDEVRRAFKVVVGIGVLALIAPAIVALTIGKNSFGGVLAGAWSALAVMKVVGFIGFEVVLLYYFRIALKSFLLVKDHRENLSLRLALCQFIEGYCDFAERVGKKGLSSIKGFEDLIFSPLPANDSNLPPTVDGVDGVARIIESLKR